MTLMYLLVYRCVFFINPLISVCLSGGDAEGGSVCVLVCAVFGDSGARRQHQPQHPGDSAGDAAGEHRHIQPTR